MIAILRSSLDSNSQPAKFDQRATEFFGYQERAAVTMEGLWMSVILGDCLEIMRTMPDESVDLVFCSPPYEAARTYGIGFGLKGQEWVDWAVERFLECVRVSRGLVAWNVEGQTRNFRYSATPVLLAADLHRHGVHLRKPPIFHRVGIPGSGGPDWLRNDYEFIICGSRGGKLAWSDNTAMGHLPKWAPGGMMSNRHQDGQRKNSHASEKCKNRNQWGHSGNGSAERRPDGSRGNASRPSHVIRQRRNQLSGDRGGAGVAQSDSYEWNYKPPALANPGNVIRCNVGGGQMGSKLAHENEAPFPEKLAEFFIRSFCPPGGIVMDIFSGSGTTAAVAKRTNRKFIAIDIRESQIELTKRRLETVQPELEFDKATV